MSTKTSCKAPTSRKLYSFTGELPEPGKAFPLDQFGGVQIDLIEVESQGSLRRFPLSQFHKLFSECFGWCSPS